MKAYLFIFIIFLIPITNFGQELLTNNEFDDDFNTDGWEEWTPGSAVTIQDTNGELENVNSCRIDATGLGGYYQLGHNVDILQDHSYQVLYINKSNSESGIFFQFTIPGVLNGGAAFMSSNNSTSSATYINTSFVAAQDTNVNAYFDVNMSEGDKIWIDGVHLKDLGVLPLTWGRVNANIIEREVLVSWQVFSQLNNQKFIIEHSKDGRKFEPIGEVDGEGNINEERNYTFIHKYPNRGTNFYRIKQIDYDGNYNFSSTMRVVWKAQEDLCFPNPVDDYYHFISKQETTLFIYSDAGNLINQYVLHKGENLIDMSSYPAGVYILKSTDGTNKRIIKQFQ